jgi:hypothetical protein
VFFSTADSLQVSAHRRKEITEHTGHEHAGQPRDDEAVVDHEFADFGRAAAIKLNRRQIARVRRQNV